MTQRSALRREQPDIPPRPVRNPPKSENLPMHDDDDVRALGVIKTVHTVVWVFFVACIVAIPVMTWRESFAAATWFTGIVFLEVVVLVVNRWRCPLTPLAARFTQDRRDNFDIYLPQWLARHNKTLFGGLYLAGVAYLVIAWILR